MDYDPLTEVIDESLAISPAVVQQLQEFRDRPKLVGLPGENTLVERTRIVSVLNELAHDLIQGIEANPSKLWVLKQFQTALELVQHEDTEGREHFGMELEEIMDILGIESSDGLLACYLGGV